MRAKKSLGQHFLASPAALAKIVGAADIAKDDLVLEIGPGKGVLTEALLALAKKVVAVEKDRELISFLNEKFAGKIKEGRLDIIEKDILEFDATALERPYLLVANIPYYVTGAILEKFLSSTHQPSR
ncbi:16S rRNA (adenine(1518)-N(6)/adenine(1519)-N(6))-dimethyltransferase, partial [Candidatus Parcubacteria bacterium]|nr:16S rRNA (adenine(1518)-N(6)/adenine(1519)-N(6))-dimethyltransferase [Candidatus Parcubacteria bacterium]